MQHPLEITRTSRRFLQNFLENHSLEELNKVPPGFKNNIIWNIAHVVVTQQVLMYKLSGLPLQVSDDMEATYQKGTKTERPATQEEVSLIKELLFTTIDQTENDLNNGVFKNFNEYPTSTGFDLKSIEDALHFNNFHEGLHIGYILALRKSL
ncbi:DinB family protein [Aquimarina sp. ERC-38]|uniref:DinB family protein n=1 Tax=Aquimarina sp. ERC-38 TaxID=2949996 RepID=UPI002245ECB3|nr:DinB family protein [Aquimarina sp. ERC-38]UZO82044.1 DinB family protein [Aquimarina sp. ERC-38]